jgi:hypothetical protein
MRWEPPLVSVLFGKSYCRRNLKELVSEPSEVTDLRKSDNPFSSAEYILGLWQSPTEKAKYTQLSYFPVQSAHFVVVEPEKKSHVKGKKGDCCQSRTNAHMDRLPLKLGMVDERGSAAYLEILSKAFALSDIF